MTPDATCNYVQAGECNGRDYARRLDGAWYLWYGTNFHWFISTVLGYPNPPGWESPGSDIFADYIGYGGAIGTAKVTKIYEVTGEPFPDATGTYKDAGEHNGRRCYQRTPDGYFIYWDGDSNWYLSDVLGGMEEYWWKRTDDNIEGVYLPQGGTVNEAIVTEVGH